jgi:hypothetical protein
MHEVLIIAPEVTLVGRAAFYFEHIKATGLTSDECGAKIKDAIWRRCNVIVSGTIHDLTPYQELAEAFNLNLVIVGAKK